MAIANMVVNAPVPVPARVARGVKVLLVLVALAAVVIAAVVVAALSYLGRHLQRQDRFDTETLASIQEVNDEWRERSEFNGHTRALLQVGDFDALDEMARELRRSRATFSSGMWKLTGLYDALGTGFRSSLEFEWEKAIAQAAGWSATRPDSVTARLVLAELWMAYGWQAQTSNPPTDKERALMMERMDQARLAAEAAAKVHEYCPQRAATELRLAVGARWSKGIESAIYDRAVRGEPEYQPYYILHLFYLEPQWEGGPVDWVQAAATLYAQTGGHEKYARVVWYRGVRGGYVPEGVTWLMLEPGFKDLVARHPESLEVKSAYCYFAWRFGDLEVTQRLLAEIGLRMHTSVWLNREQFAQAYRWAMFDNSESNRDPVARLFTRLLR